MSLNTNIANGDSRIYRAAYIKRRNNSDGLFETNWLEITDDIKTWGRITTSVDDEQYAKFRLPSMKLKVANDQGKYNPYLDENSLWNGYLPQQRSLVQIRAGFLEQTIGSDGVWSVVQYPGEYEYDTARFDAAYFDGVPDIIFTGIIAGDINLSDKNETHITVKPLTEVFRQFAAKNLNFFSSYPTGMKASEFMEGLRDMTDGSANFVFRPFFGDTTTYWDINTTTTNYSNLNTSGAEDIRDKNVWQIIEKLAEAEDHVAYVKGDGTFVFSDRTTASGSVFDFEFDGAGSGNAAAGKTIKNILSFGTKYSKYYSRVQVKFGEDDTSTSYAYKETAFSVDPTNAPWYYGDRTYSIENTWIPDTATAESIATNIWNNTSNVKDEIKFTTSFIPHLNVLESCTITYDSSEINTESLWDIRTWADTSGAAETGNELVWDASGGDAIKLSGDEFRIQSISIDLDKLQCTFSARGA